MKSGSIAKFPRVRLLLVCLWAAVSTGCGAKPQGEGIPVSGTVNYKGQPVDGATVTFLGTSFSAFGVTDASGKFKLRSAAGENVPLGDYQVTVLKMVGDEPPGGAAGEPTETAYPVPAEPPKNVLPDKYREAATSKLTAKVATGADHFKFDLE